MSQLAMPLLVVNLGCEMVYILEQRLKAQNIPTDKSCKVLNDVIKTMFDSEYIDKLFAPQDMYTVSQTRKIFDRLAHSSIMRLSESSMDKLFDLMLMGFKYQLLCSTNLDQMLEVTLLHLATMRTIIESLPDQSSAALIGTVEALAVKTFEGLPAGQLHLLRHTLLRFFQDKRVKVSLFLQEGIQSSMGRIILPSPHKDYVGTVTTYSMSGALEEQEKFKVKSAATRPIDRQEFFVHPAPLGTNLYNKERPKVVPPPRKGDAITGPLKPEEDYKTMAGEEYSDRGLRGSLGGASEFAYLSALLKVKAPAVDNFKLNLFGDDDLVGADPSPVVATRKVSNIAFTAAKNDQHLSDVMKSMKVSEGGPGKGKGGDGEDLLDLMDNA
ncbi:hypothetical protein VOLCADRAFT_107794 [Volvox carteri f. nagariensis]|uniref:Uncharacterized protein ssa4 n=1 Tax=Volvox carteri f. nagariensis TaxID=3068 RepID=D8UGG6_VOLCA|nr:uncharacterized protein VOLCADRAFT_107794 [Volvox carteri f. nagariensis]EFJ41172.1 hypothetical protein VOLCADRAFT_107794 [Volvox carteri f. nagariensis]|eukprot:XP_002957740.1 hypothetical protein VOLCADRAFT_107794 [Volvox carteri f. nagariensis]